MPQDTAPLWIKGAVWALGIGIPILVLGVGAYVGAVRDDFAARDMEHARRIATVEGVVSGHSVSLARALKHNEDHQEDARREIARIDRCEARLSELATDSTARPDPFTGSQGREIERRIDVLEQGLVKMNAMKERVAELKKTSDDERAYYRSSIVPMIQQIQIQLQKNTVSHRK